MEKLGSIKLGVSFVATEKAIAKQNRGVDLSFAFVGVLVFFIFRAILWAGWDYLHLPLIRGWDVNTPDLIALVLGVAAYLALKTNDTAKGFTAEVIIELSKVVWPPRKETLVSAVVVIVMVGIASLLLVTVDLFWGWATRKFLGI